MKEKYEISISLRYLFGRKKYGLMRIITFLSVGGVVIGVMTLIIVLSVMRGFEKDITEKILSANAHLILFRGGDFYDYNESVEELKKIKGITGINPFIVSQAMISSETNSSGAVIYGVYPENARDVLKINNYLFKGNFLSPSTDVCEIIIGKELSDSLAVDVGDEVYLISPTGKLTPFGMVPRAKRARVVGIFRIGMYDYDSSFVFMHINHARDFFGMKEGISGIQVAVKNPMKVDGVVWEIEKRLGFPYYVRTWKDLNRNLFSALKLERIVFFLMLILIILVAAFGIAVNQLMTSMEKSRDIAILMSMGAKRKDVVKIFLYHGIIIGIIGVIIGTVLALTICFLLAKYKFISLPGDVYYISKLPVDVHLIDVLLTNFSAFVICVLASIYPSIKVSKISPAEVLRYE
jgi:lipoprotein-releasing system permease protein